MEYEQLPIGAISSPTECKLQGFAFQEVQEYWFRNEASETRIIWSMPYY